MMPYRKIRFLYPALFFRVGKHAQAGYTAGKLKNMKWKNNAGKVKIMI